MEEKLLSYADGLFAGKNVPPADVERIKEAAIKKYRELIALQAGEAYAYNQAAELVRTELDALQNVPRTPYPAPPVRAKGETAAIVVSILLIVILAGTLIVGGIVLAVKGVMWAVNNSDFDDIGISTLSGGTYHFKNSDDYQTGEFSADSASADAIDIDWVAGSVILYVDETASDEIVFSEDFDGDDPDDLLRYRIKDGKISVKFKSPGELDELSKELFVIMPPSALDKVTVNSATAEVYLDGVTAKKISVNTAAGYVQLFYSSAKNTNINSVSGAVDLIGDYGPDDELDIETVSGDVYTIFDAQPESADIKTVSGGVYVAAYEDPDDLELRSVSGSVTVNGETVGKFDRSLGGRGDIEVETVSGDIEFSRENPDY